MADILPLRIKQRRQRFNGSRGPVIGCGQWEGRGWWISLEEADQRSGEKWWSSLPCQEHGILPVQYDQDGPSDRPIWMWEDGDMYLGEWQSGTGYGNKYCDGFQEGKGAHYCHSKFGGKGSPGVMYVGDFQDGFFHGEGVLFWLESSDAWRNNRCSSSYVHETPKSSSKKVPFYYKGRFQRGTFWDANAIVSLKYGPTKIGPWKDDRPLGNWHGHREFPIATGESARTPTIEGIREPEVMAPEPVPSTECAVMAPIWDDANFQSVDTARRATSTERGAEFSDMKRPYDGHRGPDDCDRGWWITLEEAHKHCGEEWWKHRACLDQGIEPKQYDEDGPQSKPIWMWENGNMYLGEWESSVFVDPLQDGLGVSYSNRGELYVGRFKSGEFHGAGETFWLASSETWRTNRLTSSWTRDSHNNCVPHIFKGNFFGGERNDEDAVVTLKDGTARAGPWKDDRPVGTWVGHRLVDHEATRDIKCEEDDGMPAAGDFHPYEEGDFASLSREEDDEKPVTEDFHPAVEPGNQAHEEGDCTTLCEEDDEKAATEDSHPSVEPRDQAKEGDFASLSHGEDDFKSTTEDANPSVEPRDQEHKEGDFASLLSVEDDYKSTAVDDFHPPIERGDQAHEEGNADEEGDAASGSNSVPRKRTRGPDYDSALDEGGAASGSNSVARKRSRGLEYDSSLDDTKKVLFGKQEPNTPAASAAAGCEAEEGKIAMGKSFEKGKQCRLEEISMFVCIALFDGELSQETAANYARGFYEMGFQSVKMLQSHLSVKYVEQMNWEAELHKEIVLEKVSVGPCKGI